jgi:hypothetical protein
LLSTSSTAGLTQRPWRQAPPFELHNTASGGGCGELHGAAAYSPQRGGPLLPSATVPADASGSPPLLLLRRGGPTFSRPRRSPPRRRTSTTPW